MKVMGKGADEMNSGAMSIPGTKETGSNVILTPDETSTAPWLSLTWT